MAYITEVSILGLAGRRGRPQEFKLDRHVNVFWGLNGSGKTSLLRILHGALYDEARTLVRVPFDSATVDFFSKQEDRIVRRHLSKDPSQQQRLEQQFRLLENESGLQTLSDSAWESVTQQLAKSADQLQWRTSPKLENSPSGRFGHRYLSTSRLFEGAARSASRVGALARRAPSTSSEVVDEAVLDQLFADQIEGLWRYYGIRALSEIRDIQQRGLADILSAMFNPREGAKSGLNEYSAEQAYDLIRDFLNEQGITTGLGSLKSFSRNYEGNPVLRDVVTKIKRTEQRVEHALEPQRVLASLLGDLYSGSKKVRFEGPKLEVWAGKSRIPLESLSSGEKQLMRLLIEAMHSGDSCLIVDEPELSLHVDWQHRLVESLRIVNPEMQLILATHSPEVMATLPDHLILEI